MNSTELTPTKSNALAAYAPLSEASAIVDIYVSSSIANDTLILWDNRFDSKLFETEILKRNDKYLDLKIASGIRDIGNGRELWGNRPLEPRALEVEFFPMEEVLHEKVKIHR
jgi:hypothetical protein